MLASTAMQVGLLSCSLAADLISHRAWTPQNDLLSEYSAHLREVIKSGINHPDHQDKPLSGLKIVVDAGNGSGGYFATQVGAVH